MAIAPGILADGQLPATTGDLYAASGNTYVTSIVVANASAAQRTVNLYVRDATNGADRLITPKDLTMDVGDTLYLTGVKLSLNNGDKIRGDADAATSVDYIVWGGT